MALKTVPTSTSRLRLAIVVSHPIQHFAPWYRELAKLPHIELKLFFYCDWGAQSYHDPEFGVEVKWDIPLLEGYDFEILPTKKPLTSMSFWELDNPSVGEALERFQPDVVQLYGYASRTNWRVARWTRKHATPLMIYSDSNSRAKTPQWKRQIKRAVVGYFYSHVDGALYVGDSNHAYHASYGLPERRLFAGALPVDTQALLRTVSDPQFTRASIRRELQIPENGFVVLQCGKLSQRKRPLDLVQAAHQARKSGANLWIVLVGEGAERPSIEEFCRKERTDNIRLAGFINQTKISNYYVAADALAVTSEADPHPLVITEAATFGLPAIVSDAIGCIGPNDTARPGENAFPYPCGDIESLKKILVNLSSDRVLYQHAREASLRIAKDQDVAVVAKQLFHAASELKKLGVRQ